MRIYEIGKELETMSATDFDLYKNGELIFAGSAVLNELYNYSLRKTTRPIFILWNCFTNLFWDAYYKQYEQLTKNVNVLENFKQTEKGYKTHSDGDKTITNTPDSTRNYTETTNTYDYTKTYSAGTGDNTPTTDTYDLSYNTEPKHTSYTTQKGQTEESTHNNGTGDKVKTVNNLKTEQKETHTDISKTFDNKTLTGDAIETYENEKAGYNTNIPETLKNAVELYKQSILNEMILHFIDKYTFYIGGDELAFEFV